MGFQGKCWVWAVLPSSRKAGLAVEYIGLEKPGVKVLLHREVIFTNVVLWRLSFLCNTLKTLSRARRILYLNICVPVPAACSGPHWDFELRELLVLKCLSESWNLFCGTATRHVHGQSFPCEGLHHLLVLFCSWNARNDLLCALCWVPGRVRKLRAVALWELHGREVQEQQDQLGEGLNLMETVDITVTFKF